MTRRPGLPLLGSVTPDLGLTTNSIPLNREGTNHELVQCGETNEDPFGCHIGCRGSDSSTMDDWLALP